ncbi:hypothetical protein [Sabulicella rubraurantiaca]|nr:hypothetical protein [Sabulicella rubraurantiaca]
MLTCEAAVAHVAALMAEARREGIEVAAKWHDSMARQSQESEK